MTELNVPDNIVMIINIVSNLDKISLIQLAIAKLGVYKFLVYLIYFAFLA